MDRARPLPLFAGAAAAIVLAGPVLRHVAAVAFSPVPGSNWRWLLEPRFTGELGFLLAVCGTFALVGLALCLAGPRAPAVAGAGAVVLAVGGLYTILGAVLLASLFRTGPLVRLGSLLVLVAIAAVLWAAVDWSRWLDGRRGAGVRAAAVAVASALLLAGALALMMDQPGGVFARREPVWDRTMVGALVEAATRGAAGLATILLAATGALLVRRRAREASQDRASPASP